MAAFVLRVAPPVSSSSLSHTRKRETEPSLCPSISFSPSSSFSQFPCLSFSVTQQRSNRGCMVVAAIPAYKKAGKSYHNVIYVHDISINTTKESFKNAFQKFGEVDKVMLLIDKSNNLPRGYGFVYYATEEEAKKAIEAMNGQTIKMLAESLEPQNCVNVELIYSLDGKTIAVKPVEPAEPAEPAEPVEAVEAVEAMELAFEDS